MVTGQLMVGLPFADIPLREIPLSPEIPLNQQSWILLRGESRSVGRQFMGRGPWLKYYKQRGLMRLGRVKGNLCD